MSNLNIKKKKLAAEEITVLGVPFDSNSSFLRGAALAPLRIREALFSESTNMWTEKSIDLGLMSGWQFLINELLNKKVRVISIGGDHSITYPIIRAYGKWYNKLSILHLDAHPDLYDELYGNRHSHACPFARIMEENLVKRLLQVGVRTLTGHQREQAKRFGVEIIEMREIDRVNEIMFNGPVYLSLDMDCLRFWE